MDGLKVLFWGQDRSGCTWYRTILPGKALEDRYPANYAVLDANWSGDRMNDAIEIFDVLVCGRKFDRDWLEVAVNAVKGGIPVVYDLDDNLFEVSPYSTSYQWFGLEEVKIPDGRGGERWLWRDGRGGFDIQRNERTIKGAVEMMRLAAGITVTTPELARIYEPFNDKVAVLPNCVNVQDWPLLEVKHEGLRIGWSGGSSHLEDFAHIKPVLKELWSDPEFAARATFVNAGSHFPAMTEVIPDGCLEVHPWVDVAAHSFKQATLGLDLAMIPLEDTRFNRCKSALKWIEYSALGVPCVCSNIPPYKPVIERGKTGFLVNDRTDWIKVIKMLADDPERRRKVGLAARKEVEQRFDQNLYAQAWDRAIRWMANDRLRTGVQAA